MIHPRGPVMAPPPNLAPRPITGRHVLFGILGFFAVTTGVNGVMIYKAVTTFGGIESADAYRRGLAYNERIAAEERQTALGWQLVVGLSADKRGITVRLRDRDGRPVTALSVTAILGRSATNRYDRPLTLREASSGDYEAPVTGLGPGTWIVTINAAHDQGDHAVFAARRRIWVNQ